MRDDFRQSIYTAPAGRPSHNEDAARYLQRAWGGVCVFFKRAWPAAASFLWSAADALPPYRKIEGPLEQKETDSHGKRVIVVCTASIEVDAMTFDALVVGEYLRVRYTRGCRAINIDRIVPSRGPGQGLENRWLSAFRLP